MIQHTWKRAKALSPSQQVVTVMDQSHWGYVRTQLIQETLGRVVWQPENRGTGPGVFLPLSYIRSHDPNATVVLWPADHFVFPAAPLIRLIREAAALVHHEPQRMLLVTVPPQSGEKDYGWVIPGALFPHHGGCRVREVRRFVEKPQDSQLAEISLEGGQWIPWWSSPTFKHYGKQVVSVFLRLSCLLKNMRGGLEPRVSGKFS